MTTKQMMDIWAERQRVKEDRTSRIIDEAAEAVEKLSTEDLEKLLKGFNENMFAMAGRIAGTIMERKEVMPDSDVENKNLNEFRNHIESRFSKVN